MRTQRSAPAIVGTLLGLALVAALGGCGIRSTSVPVDAGAAPSRVPCTAPAPSRSPAAAPSASVSPSAAEGAGRESVPVYLVCGEKVTTVERTLPRGVGRTGHGSTAMNPADRLAAARTLLRELRTKPDRAESAAGFSTDVPGDLDVSGPRGGDPAATLRLSAEQNQLPPFALAQIVCTFARATATAHDSAGTVVLGFGDSGAPRRFSCSGDLRTRREAGRAAGTAVR